MDEKNSTGNKDEFVGDLHRARGLYEKAAALLDTDLETAANRIYLSYENLAHAILY